MSGEILWGKTFDKFATTAIHHGQDPEQWNCMMVVPPITTSSTFKQSTPGVTAGYDYTRGGNPTRECLEKCVAALEGGKHGMAFSSGLAACMTAINMLKAGDHVLTTDDVYGGTNRYFQRVAKKFALEFDFVDFTSLDKVKAAIRPNTKMIWCESPTNPTMKVTDLRAVSELIKDRKDIVFVVDNTFMTPYFQRPLMLGADIVMHSATKYMNGHSDVLMGLLITNSDELYKKLQFLQFATGPVPSPFDCYLCNRGLKTLAVRMAKHQENAIKVCKFLEGHKFVERVSYAGSPNHPQFEIMKRQATGCSGMIAFWVEGNLQQTKVFLESLRLFTLAESLGGYESLAEHPALMTHASVPPEARKELGIEDNFVRLSVGLENAEDLIDDLTQALDKSMKA